MADSSPKSRRKGPVDAAEPTAQGELAQLTFEDALDRVEGIIERIERGDVGLEESLVEYERGIELIRRCRSVLERAEQKVEELTRRMEGDAGAAEGKAPDRGT